LVSGIIMNYKAKRLSPWRTWRAWRGLHPEEFFILHALHVLHG
jgi:hypothetical protein